jgi:hypothetical protein
MKSDPRILKDRVIAALPGTRQQIQRRAQVGSTTVSKWLRILRQDGAVHISGWRRSHQGSKQPIFSWGAGEDKPPPKTLTPEQSTKRFRKRHPERFKELQRLSYRRCITRKNGHGFLAALFF